MKKFISLFLVFSILLLSGNLFAKERKGADLIIKKTDSRQVMGELIAVKEKSLLLLERDSGADGTVDIGDVEVIRIVKKGKAGTGILIGGAIGVFVGYLTYSKPKSEGWFTLDFGPGMNAAVGGILGGLIGLVIGAMAGTDETIQIGGKSDTEIEAELEKLRKKARVRNSQ
jgi:hypothetical protein